MGNSCSCSFRRVEAADVIIFNLEELNAYMDAVGERKFLGKGAFGFVYRGIVSGRIERNINGKQVAIKSSRRNDERTRTQWLAEREYLPQLLHQNIIELIGYCETTQRFYLIYPYIQNGTVSSLDWSKTLKIMRGVARAIQKLHEQEPPLIHRDIKLNNVLLDEDFTPKLADFGMVSQEEEHLRPESTRADDMKSFGVMILQLIMKEENASIPGVRSLAWHISEWANRIYMQKKHAVHQALISRGCATTAATAVTELGLDCVKADPLERPTIAQVIIRLENL